MDNKNSFNDMEYLKLFNTESDYLAYRDGKDFVRPNVSLCNDKGNEYYNSTPPIVYEAIDLGLPSGTKWATCNVGAKKPSDYGLYFQWGDTQGYTANQVGIGKGKKQFASNKSDYKWYARRKFTKYVKYIPDGAALALMDDAAHVNMGGDWQMPTAAQMSELINNTTSIWTTQDGVNGRLFASKKDKSRSIFIPAAGYALNGSIHGSRNEGYSWSSVIDTNEGSGRNLYFNSNNTVSFNIGRCCGIPIRGVIG